MESPVIIREFAPIRGLRLFTSIPDGHRVVRVNRPNPGSIYSHGMYVVVDPARTELVEGIDVAMAATGGPRDGFEQIAVVRELCQAFGGWCTAPGGGAHSQIMGGGKPLRLVDGPINPEGLQRSLIGTVVGYLGEIWGEPIRDLWPDDRDQPIKHDAFDSGDLPNLYIMKCDGDCLVPVYRSGVRLQFDATAAVEPGDYVGLWLKPIHTYETLNHQAMVKRLVTPLPVGPFPLPDSVPAPPVILVEMLNPSRTFVVSLNRVMAIHKCEGEATTPVWKPSRAEMRAMVADERAAARPNRSSVAVHVRQRQQAIEHRTAFQSPTRAR